METGFPAPRPFQRLFEDGQILASRLRRLLGGFVDGGVASLVYLAAREAQVSGWLAFATIGVSTVCFTRWFGGTPGKLIVGMRVVVARDGGSVGWIGAAMRWLVTASVVVVGALLGANAIVQLLLFVAQMAIYAPILWDPHAQGLHDRVANTVVVQCRSGRDSAKRGAHIAARRSTASPEAASRVRTQTGRRPAGARDRPR